MSIILFAEKHLFVGSYLQVTWWALGQWKGRKKYIEWQKQLIQLPSFWNIISPQSQSNFQNCHHKFLILNYCFIWPCQHSSKGSITITLCSNYLWIVHFRQAPVILKFHHILSFYCLWWNQNLKIFDFLGS